jgi:hypothetical protein
MTTRIADLFPSCPPAERVAIAEHTAVRGSGRVGRSEAGRSLEPAALTAAVIAAIRHRRTNYDELLSKGIERTAAREEVRAAIDTILANWRLSPTSAQKSPHQPEALTRLVRNEAARRLAALGASDPAAEATPRRRTED